MMRRHKMTDEILEEARKLWFDGMGYRPMARLLNEKYPKLGISHQSLMSLLSPKYLARNVERKKISRATIIAARRKEYTDSLKKLYAIPKKKTN